MGTHCQGQEKREPPLVSLSGIPLASKAKWAISLRHQILSQLSFETEALPWPEESFGFVGCTSQTEICVGTLSWQVGAHQKGRLQAGAVKCSKMFAVLS